MERQLSAMSCPLSAIGSQGDCPESRELTAESPVPYAVLGLDVPAGVVGTPCGIRVPAPREIISCNSSGLDERDSAVCSEICFLK